MKHPKLKAFYKAAKATIHGFKGEGGSGASGMAKETNTTPQMLSNWVNWNSAHMMPVDHLVRAMELQNDYTALHELNRACKFIAQPTDIKEFPAGMDVIEESMGWQHETGETAQAVTTAIRNPRGIMPHQVDDIERELYEDYIKGLRLVATLRKMQEKVPDNVVNLGDKR